MLQTALAILAVPLVVLGGRDFWRGMTADDADQFKAVVYVNARTAVVAFAITAVFLASVSGVLAVVFMVLSACFQFAVSDRFIDPTDRTV